MQLYQKRWLSAIASGGPWRRRQDTGDGYDMQ